MLNQFVEALCGHSPPPRSEKNIENAKNVQIIYASETPTVYQLTRCAEERKRGAEEQRKKSEECSSGTQKKNEKKNAAGDKKMGPETIIINFYYLWQLEFLGFLFTVLGAYLPFPRSLSVLHACISLPPSLDLSST